MRCHLFLDLSYDKYRILSVFHFNRSKMNKNLRYRLVLEMFRSNELLKAVAMSLLVRKRINGNTVRNFTINKLATITWMHATTIKKRLHTLKECGLVSYNGKSLIFRSLVSRHKQRNVRLAKVAYDKIKDVERSLQAILVAVMQIRKDFVKRTILTAHNGRYPKEVKRAQKLSRRYKWGHDYVERGLGYGKIAKSLNLCKATAVKIIKFAQKRGILTKQTNYDWYFMPGINFLDMKDHGYTFTTKNYACVVRANTYTVAPCLTAW